MLKDVASSAADAADNAADAAAFLDGAAISALSSRITADRNF